MALAATSTTRRSTLRLNLDFQPFRILSITIITSTSNLTHIHIFPTSRPYHELRASPDLPAEKSCHNHAFFPDLPWKTLVMSKTTFWCTVYKVIMPGFNPCHLFGNLYKCMSLLFMYNQCFPMLKQRIPLWQYSIYTKHTSLFTHKTF